MNSPKPGKPITKISRPELREFEEILKRASDKKASDLHLKAGLPPVVRVNGNLFYLGDDSGENIVRLTDEQLDHWSNTLMNDRQLEAYSRGEEVDLGYEIPGGGRYRINLCQQRGRPRMVCRYIPDTIRGLDELNLPKAVTDLLAAKRGLILVTGATGSGKSTTLAAMIDHIARTRSCHIITIEDPIEFAFKDRRSIVTQREVGMDTASFSKALKYALRQDPDVILVGEMRDEETIHMALTAAETGHLVLSTLHTNDATETINRILASVQGDTQASTRMQLASVLVAVISQRLIPRLDKKGRVAAVEILVNNARVSDLILDPARTTEIRSVLDESTDIGMQSFDRSLMEHCRTKVISEEEAIAQCTNPRDFKLRLQGVTSGDWNNKGGHASGTRINALSDEIIEIEEGLGPPKKKA
jgi:twitching motility protein PilT